MQSPSVREGLEKRLEAIMDQWGSDTYTIRVVVDALLIDRDEHFKIGNDRLWGEGNWIRCDTCADGAGMPSYHHKDFHG